ncbi:double-strand break repair protein AddB [Ensifer soli]|uniref:double-strand break repair protein AddB n=1 Tax=Ciceribacter sp. sgz301302 TaxID=3342379 RepID=UPI0035B882F3
MATEAAAGNVLTIPPGLPFLRTLAQALCDGRLVEGYRHDGSDPLSLAGITLFVPTRRAARVLRSEFVDCLGGRSAILPVIRALGETDDDSGFFDADVPILLDLAPPLPNAARLIELGRLILAWRNRLPAAITAVHAESPLIAPASPADALWLARNLCELIDAIETEEVDWSALDRLEAGEHALWWELTQEFLGIARVYWQDRLVELRRSSPSRHRNAVLDAETERIATRPSDGPVIIAGSTGSIPATASLIAAVQKRDDGVIVLPGLDQDMTDAQWTALATEQADGRSETSERSHPQYGLFRLLRRMGVPRHAVRAIGAAPDDLALRQTLVSAAMLPSEATDQWPDVMRGVNADALQAAFAGVTLIEAAAEREEATAIAVALRLALGEETESRAALVTPDRDLARRVVAELHRFGIEADDSAGTPLAETPPGTLAILATEAALRPGDPVAIAALLKHPLLRLGLPAEAVRASAGVVERVALRGGTRAIEIGELEPLLAARWAAESAERHRTEWRGDITDASIAGAADLCRRLAAAIEPLASALGTLGRGGRPLSAELPLSDWATRTGRALEAIAIDARGDLAGLWGGEAGEALAGLFQTVIETDGQMQADGSQWCDIVVALMTGEAIKPPAMRHPRVFIFGALESRLQSVDTIVLGGLNEGVWPPQSANNPFLSRAMKIAMGLEPPERRIGQLAHDLQMAAGTRQLVLTRALRQGGAPTVASRWLQRLMALGGQALSEPMRARGAAYRHWVAALDDRPAEPRAERPAPRPPAERQPLTYSFSEIARLRRDPYAVYARRILRLQPVGAFTVEPGASERGTLYHRVVERFVSAGIDPASAEAEAALKRLIREALDSHPLPPHADHLWRLRLGAVADAFLDWERRRRPTLAASRTEVPATMAVGVGEIRLTGIADRIDLLPDGRAVLIDYKTGSSPSEKEARALLDPQLPLEAAVLKAGGFRGLGRHVAAELLYVRLKPGERFDVTAVNNEAKKGGRSADDLADAALAELRKLLDALLSGRHGFASRLIMQRQRDWGGEYDHLARVAEWSTDDGEEGGDDA